MSKTLPAWVLAPVAATLVLVVGACTAEPKDVAPQSRSSLPADVYLPGWNSPDGVFVDADHGFLLLGRCPDAVCETWVGVTADGGASWDGALVPGLTFERSYGDRRFVPRVQLIALDAETVILEGYDITPYGGPDHHRWLTSDGGRSWAEVPVRPVETIEEIPAEGHVFADFDDVEAHTVTVRVIRPDGSSAAIANPPKADYLISELRTGVTETPDGGLWFYAGGDTSFSIFHSVDRGRTWAEVPHPVGVPGHGYEFHPASGKTLYLTDTGAFKAWRSNDSGQTWVELAVGFDNGGEDFGLTGIDFPDGRLMLIKPVLDGGTYRAEYVGTTATGTTFEPVDWLAETRTVPGFGPRPDLAPHASGPQGVLGLDGSWIALPFSCWQDTDC